MRVSDVVKQGVITSFSHYRQGYLYYLIPYDGHIYSYPVEVADLATATVSAEEKAITMMRYIRKAIDGESLVRVSK